MSPELSQDKKTESPAEIAQDLKEVYGSVELDSGSRIVLDPDIQAMNFSHNRQEMVFQDLMAIIKAGGDFFSVVNAYGAGDKNPTTLITHHEKDGRAEIVGHIENGGGPLVIGRNHDNGYSSTTSREHFLVAKSDKGEIGIADTNSSNGTEIFATTVHIDSVRNKPEVIRDGSFWSGKSSAVRHYLASIR